MARARAISVSLSSLQPVLVRGSLVSLVTHSSTCAAPTEIDRTKVPSTRWHRLQPVLPEFLHALDLRDRRVVLNPTDCPLRRVCGGTRPSARAGSDEARRTVTFRRAGSSSSSHSVRDARTRPRGMRVSGEVSTGYDPLHSVRIVISVRIPTVSGSSLSAIALRTVRGSLLR